MLVRAKENKQADIPENVRMYAFGQEKNGQLPLTINKKYVVCGIRRAYGHDFYLVISDANELYRHPWWYPAKLFEVVNSTVPDDWIKGNIGESEYNTFPELATDTTGMFENNLEDGEEHEMEIFLKKYDKYLKLHQS